MPTAVEQYQTLTRIWKGWREVAQMSGGTQRDRAEAAINRLYHAFGHDAPRVTWSETPRAHSTDRIDRPLMLTFRHSLAYANWHTLKHPEWLMTQIGYDLRMHDFRLAANKQLVFAPSHNRPWSHATGATNVISQFDVDVLAIHELTTQFGKVDRELTMLADIISEIALSCFAAILFEHTCTLIDKPSIVGLNDAQQLSVQRAPAIAWLAADTSASPRPRAVDGRYLAREYGKDHRLYAVNGFLISRNAPPEPLNENILHASPRYRTLLIEYHGWDQFFDFMRKKYREVVIKLQEDRYGKVYRIMFRNQVFHVLRVRNSSPEPDGSFRHYVIAIDRDCRPLPDPRQPYSVHGAPQTMTALNAVASTFGMTGDVYAAEIGSES